MIAQVKGNLLRIREAQPLTQGSVGLTLELELSEEWTGLAVTALFSAGHLTRDVAVSGESLTIPWELLAEADHKLLLSIYGALPNRGTVLTTNIASLGPIEASLQPSGHEPDAPSPSRADQIQAMAEQALSVAQGLRRDADSGAFDGRDGSSPSARVTKSGRTATIEITDQNGTTTATVQDCDIDREEFDQQGQGILSLQGAVAALQAERYKGFAIDSASGAVAAFPDGADDIPVRDLTVTIEAVQSGTGDPSPDNVRPISGWTGANVTRTGKNLFQLGLVPSAKSGVTVTDIPDGYRLTATAAAGYIWARFRLLDAAKFAGKTLTVKGKVLVSASQSTQISLHYRDTSDAPIQLISGAATNGYATATLTLPSDATGNVSVALYCTTSPAASIGDTAEWTELQLEIGSSATAYEPYQGDTYSIAFPAAAGTVYGGTLDVTAGKLTVDRVVITPATVSDGAYTFNARYCPWVTTAIGTVSQGSTMICNALPYKTTASNAAQATAPAFGRMNNGTMVLNPYGTMYDTIAEARAAGNQFITDHSLTICYELAAPVVYDLTPTEVTTLLGTNIIWADCGESTVEYRADTALYVDKKIAALAAAMN